MKPKTLTCCGWGLAGKKPYLESIAPYAKLKYKASADGCLTGLILER